MANQQDPVAAEKVRARIKSNLFGEDAGLRIGRYLVLRKLGEGGIGVVYAAHDPELDRKVALKLLRVGARSSLTKEAKAMARLRHANLVAVHDVGNHDGHVFIAMEFVDGSTLRDWLRQPHSLGHVLDVIEQAGDGLAALHEGGLVHRDFKPDNVMVDASGEARVADFGLAREIDDASVDLPGDELAATGSLAGTPAYMAPEVFKGEPADERGDQFGFCVTAYEAIFGERPFAGDTVAELSENVLAFRVRDTPRASGRPAWLRRLLLRGLATKPSDRFKSMAQLVAELRKYRERGQRRLVRFGALSLVGATAAALAFGLPGQQSELCSGAEAELGDTWSLSQQSVVQKAFAATNVSYAGSTFDRVKTVFDDHGNAWKSAHTETCKATRSRREVSEQVMDLRMACLARRKNEVDALIDVFADADKDVVKKATDAVGSLVPVASCSDIKSTEMGVPTPENPGKRTAVENVRARMAEANALYVAGRWEQSGKLVAGLMTEVKKIGYHPLLAEAHLLRGNSLGRFGKKSESLESLDQAVWFAEASGYDSVAANALVTALSTNITSGNKSERVQELIRRADAATRRHGELAERGRFFAVHALYYGRRGDAKNSVALHKKAVAAAEKANAGPLEISTRISYLSAALRRGGDYPASLTAATRAVELAQHSRSDEHPLMAGPYQALGAAHWRLGDYDKAILYTSKALEIRERALGVGHPGTASALMLLASLHSRKGRFAEAISHNQRVIALETKQYGRDSTRVADALGNMAIDEGRLGQYAQARIHHEQALAMYLKALGAKHKNLGLVHENLAQLALSEGNAQLARVHARKSLSIMENALSPKHVWTSYPLTSLGIAELELGRANSALVFLERSLVIRTEHKVAAPELAETKFATARALWKVGGDRKRALRLAGEALDKFGDQLKHKRAKAVIWLQERGETL